MLYILKFCIWISYPKLHSTPLNTVCWTLENAPISIYNLYLLVYFTHLNVPRQDDDDLATLPLVVPFKMTGEWNKKCRVRVPSLFSKHSLNIIKAAAPADEPSPSHSLNQSPERVSVFPLFWALRIFGNINVELSLQSDWYQNGFVVGICTEKHRAGLCFPIVTSRKNIIQRRFVFSPSGEKKLTSGAH